eukprot:CAMPEP_0173340218 /NCGR_PEP_ID=MMETSP1144-20121109/8845_1 /TAXON_ID=483371 /ORGANISM="non described non described, Strain CCMP2298" /LENGTH=93 /DNA_ID=CAMNT_0014286307 /DNA_START=871 /DNA_END=1149 /DNA_ORIENTATION=-
MRDSGEWLGRAAQSAPCTAAAAAEAPAVCASSHDRFTAHMSTPAPIPAPAPDAAPGGFDPVPVLVVRAGIETHCSGIGAGTGVGAGTGIGTEA